MNKEQSLPLVSIIMGAYNCEKTIDKCMESVLNQTYTNWEFIICDDCSTDSTLQVLYTYQTKNDRIKVIHNDSNLMLAASLNKCLQLANGRYIARMDADDYCTYNRLSIQVDFLEENSEYDVVGSQRYIFNESGILGVTKSNPYPTKMALLKSTPFAHPTIMMRKSVYDELHGYRANAFTQRAEDLDLWFRFYHKGFSGCVLDIPLYYYREGIEDYRKRSLKAALKTMCVYFAGYKKIGIPVYKYVYAFKPIVSFFVPNKILYKRRIKGLERTEN